LVEQLLSVVIGKSIVKLKLNPIEIFEIVLICQGIVQNVGDGHNQLDWLQLRVKIIKSLDHGSMFILLFKQKLNLLLKVFEISHFQGVKLLLHFLLPDF
jgi:hypothetical protein